MAKTKIEHFAEDFSLFIEAGFIAVKQLDETSAIRLFQAAKVLQPENTASEIGMGYIALNKLDVAEAVKRFEGVLQKEPDNYLAKAFLGMSYLLTKPKQEEGEKLLQEVVSGSDDPTIQNLGKTSLEWLEKDLKKEKINSPFFEEREKSSK
jgi:lipopolysaccharide biosynthesis regulator YciM